jgi:serine beta-lactamase-like protein LACTB
VESFLTPAGALRVLLVVALLASTGVLANEQATPSGARAASGASEDERISRSRDRAWTLTSRESLPGVSIAVLRRGEIVWSEGFGFANLEHGVAVTSQTRFRIASISKSLTMALVGRLMEQGVLDLDAPIQRYVPSFPDKKRSITLRLLAAHRAGLAHYDDEDMINSVRYADMTAALAKFRDRPLEHAPGARFSYSSFGYNLIGAAVEGATHEPFILTMARQVTDPLGLTRTVPDAYPEIIPGRTAFYQRDSRGRVTNAPAVDNSDVWAAGGYLSTAEDLVRFGNAVVEGGFLQPRTLAMLLEPDPANLAEGEAYGLGWQVESRDGYAIVGHDGSHFGAMSRLRVYRGTGVSVAVLVNLSIDAANEVESALHRLVHETALDFIVTDRR